MGCKEALLTLGEKPELRYKAAREALDEMGFDSTLDYVAHIAETLINQAGLFPHINAGNMDRQWFDRLKPFSPSMGLMLESGAERLCQKGMPHYGSPDKQPAVRLATIEAAGEAAVPFTSGILIGIGETRAERIESLLQLRRLHWRYGHLQEIIIQNFRAWEGTRMATAPEPKLEELLWTVAVARLIFGPEMNIQAPPNLSPGVLPKLVGAGINDWGGVSPLTPDFVNPDAPWPHLEQLRSETAVAGKILQERLTIYPSFIRASERWVSDSGRHRIRCATDSDGWPRTDDWTAGAECAIPATESQQLRAAFTPQQDALQSLLNRALEGDRLSESEIVRLLRARGDEFSRVCAAANALRQRLHGDRISYAVNRNINYTNLCQYRCTFCAFSKGSTEDHLRGKPYDLDESEIQRRVLEAWSRGATEVCLQGGIHPAYTGDKYLRLCELVKEAVPEMHIHAFSPLEVYHGAQTLGISVPQFLTRLRDAGLGSLPGTAAEILDDGVREIICPDKLSTAQWCEVIEAAHAAGLMTTATMMFGHVESLEHQARHLRRVRDIAERTGGFTEFVPLPFVSSESPTFLRGVARPGPTYRETMLVYAVARLVLYPHVRHIQASWVKIGVVGIADSILAGCDDVGGSLMNESITRAAGAVHGQEWSPDSITSTLAEQGFEPWHRTTLYLHAPADRARAAVSALALAPIHNTPVSSHRQSKATQSLNNDRCAT